MIVKDKLLAVLRIFEWGDYRQGMGSGPHGSGNDGPRIPCCPVCRGIHPDEGRREFCKDALGHREHCYLDLLLKDKSPTELEWVRKERDASDTSLDDKNAEIKQLKQLVEKLSTALQGSRNRVLDEAASMMESRSDTALEHGFKEVAASARVCRDIILAAKDK